VLVCIASLLGAVYPFRMFFVAFLGAPARRRGFSPERVREVAASMRVPTVVLALLSAVGGFAGIEGARYTFGKFVYAGPGSQNEGFGVAGAALGGSLALAGVAVVWLVWARPPPVLARMRRRLAGMGALAADGFRIDAAYGWLVDRLVLRPAALIPRVDDSLTDGIADGAAQGVGLLGTVARRLQNGRLQVYAITAVGSTAVLVGCVALAATGHLPGVGGSR